MMMKKYLSLMMEVMQMRRRKKVKPLPTQRRTSSAMTTNSKMSNLTAKMTAVKPNSAARKTWAATTAMSMMRRYSRKSRPRPTRRRTRKTRIKKALALPTMKISHTSWKRTQKRPSMIRKRSS